MTDRPIIFSAPMVRALLEGRKTQTRRQLKVRKGLKIADLENGPEYGPGRFLVAKLDDCQKPRIKIGDRLWLREAWRTESDCYNDHAPSAMSGEESIVYEADTDWSQNKSTARVRAAMHMPRWASRLTLIVTDVRVQRVQNISAADAEAEGIEWLTAGWRCYLQCPKGQDMWTCPRESYRTLWTAIYGAESWAANPWVAAYSFEIIRQNINTLGAE